VNYPFEPLEFVKYTPEQMLERSTAYYDEMARRRSVRHYSDRAVDRAIVENAIRTAGTAPSGAHKQPWHFALVGGLEVKRKIREAAEAEERESYENRMPQTWLDDLAPLGTDWHKPFLTTCPWLVVILAKTYGLEESGEKRKNYYVQESVGIAVGMLLAALHHAGLATLTHTPSPMGFLPEALGRPGNERAYMLVALGYPEEGCEVPQLERLPLESIMTSY